MASSDDEGETFPDAISDYYFNDGEEEPLSFSKLAVQWNESESSTANVGPIFLGGTVDKGLRKFYQQVKAWKYDFIKDIPEILILSKDNHWIKLQKPRKSYENLIRTILITVHCLCYLKRKPEASGKSVWDHLLKVFSLYDVRPSENDLVDHMNFIREAVKRDETLAKSKFLAAFLENPRKRKSPDEDVGTATKPSFIVDDVNGELQDDDFIAKQTKDSDSDDDAGHFDSVCAICDNGGELVCCDGKCFRSFHATGEPEEAQEVNCESLGLTPVEIEAPQYKCENCRYNIHQCFVCGELGSSDKSSNTEVFRCSSATCGNFYHPHCVASLLQKNDKAEQQSLKEKISAGDPFICPAHKCAVCKQTENEKVEDFQFAICRRCPTSYHRKCLPSDIMFDECDEVRAWDGLLNKSRALIYCMKHEIDEELGTPARTLIFKNILHQKTEKPSQPLKKKKKIPVKETNADLENSSKKKSIITSLNRVEKRFVKPEVSSKKRAAVVSSGSESLKKKKIADNSKNSLRRNLLIKGNKTNLNDNQPSLGSRLFDLYTGTESNNVEMDDNSVDDDKQIMEDKSRHTEILPPIDDDSKQRILALMKDASSSITLEAIKKQHKGKVPSTHAHSSRVDKSIILARVEGSVEALHVALKKLEEGCSVEDAMAVCEPAVIDQILRWKEKLRVYLAPFLHGMRYTSFGRHFTKVEKLEKIVDKLQWYIEDGDTVVDFCCGANDFSCLVKKRLDEMGKKKCSYKNYDITPPKNDFNFEKRDWMTVRPKELPNGSRLIMGLNPPFGTKACLANQFIDSALRFKPKLIVLIVPPETERLDSEKKKTPYDLVWEDVELLSGKSFYLPGSVDVNDKQMDQWNNTPPPLYLWSRPDMTNKHKSIAQQHGHIPKSQEPPQSVETMPEVPLPIANIEPEKDVSAPLDDTPVTNKQPKRTPNKAKKTNNKNKKKKKQSPGNKTGATETKIKPIRNDEKSNQENKVEKSEEKTQVPSREVEAQMNEKTRVPARDDQENKFEKNEEKPSRVPSREVEAQKTENARVPSRDNQGNKFEKKEDKHSQVPSREVEAQKNEKVRAPSRDNQEIKLEKNDSRVPSREVEAKKNEKARAPSRDNQVEKNEEKHAWVPSREVVAQKNEKTRVPSREDPPPKNDRTRVPSREDPSQKHETTRGPAREVEAQKHDNTWGRDKARGPARETEPPHKFDNKHNFAPSREDKHSPGPTRQDHLHETRESDFSFVDDVGQELFDQSLERRYNSALDESTFSFQNEVGQPFDPIIERRYNQTTDEPPYVGSGSTYRRLDGPNLATSSYSMRPDPVSAPYPGYDRVGRGSYYDEMSAPRISTGSYSMAHHEPGLTRYGSMGSVETTPYNRAGGGTSAMNRYAPRLDELNHTMMNNLGRPELDELSHTRMGNMGRSEPPTMGSRGMGGYGPSVHGPAFRTDTMGFAPGPYNPYAHHNLSGGWLNE